jgi:hypothetical protein
MWRLIILASLTACASGGAQAATCQDSFAKKGNPLGGLRFTAEVTVTDLTPPTAIRQFRGIAASDGYDITVDEAEEGSMLIEQPRSPSGATRPIPIVVSATASGTASTIKLEAKMPGGTPTGYATIVTPIVHCQRRRRSGNADHTLVWATHPDGRFH